MIVKNLLIVALALFAISCSKGDPKEDELDFSLNSYNISIFERDTFQIEFVLPNTHQNYSVYASYISLDNSIATVSNDGLITAVKEGETSIEVQAGDVLKTISVSVKYKPLSYQEYYEKYCYGYAVRDTTHLVVFNQSHYLPDPDTIYLSGIRNGKIWIGAFDVSTKEQLYDFIDDQNLELSQQVHIGYGEYVNIDITRIDVLAFFNDPVSQFLNIKLRNGRDNYKSMVIFSDKATISRQYYDNETCNIHKWYNHSVLLKRQNGAMTYYYVYSPTGEVIFDGSHNRNAGFDTLYDLGLYDAGVVPISYDSFICIEISMGYQNFDACSLVRYKLGATYNGSHKWNTLIQYVPNGAKRKWEIIGQKDDLWEYKFHYVAYDGSIGDRHFVINVGTGELADI